MDVDLGHATGQIEPETCLGHFADLAMGEARQVVEIGGFEGAQGALGRGDATVEFAIGIPNLHPPEVIGDEGQ